MNNIFSIILVPRQLWTPLQSSNVGLSPYESSCQKNPASEIAMVMMLGGNDQPWGPGRYSDWSVFRQVVSPPGLYSDRSIFRQVYIPTGRWSKLVRQVDSPTNRSILRKIYIPTGRYSDIKIKAKRGLTVTVVMNSDEDERAHETGLYIYLCNVV